MTTPQPGIIADVPTHCRYLEFHLKPDRDPRSVVQTLKAEPVGEDTVIGFGPALVKALEGHVEGLHAFPNFVGPACAIPATQADLWIWIRGEDRGVITHQSMKWQAMLAGAFDRVRSVDGFKYSSGLDLTGYEDGTENPEGDEAATVAFAGGSSFVAVQQWVHDLSHFAALAQAERDNVIGRRISDNEEISDAPPSAHVKRTEQERVDPPAKVLRRSMPWADATGEGLVFVAFGRSLEAFEMHLQHMTGQDDAIVDGLFRFTRPVTGSYFWCPPLKDGKLDLSALNL